MDQQFDNAVQLETAADNIVISRPKDVFQALCSILCLYWVYDIAYSKQLSKTLGFLGSHVCKLEPGKASVAVQRRLNLLYSL